MIPESEATRPQVLELLQAKLDATDAQRRFVGSAIFYAVLAVAGFSAFFEERIRELLDVYPEHTLHAITQALILSLSVIIGFPAFRMLQFQWSDGVEFTSQDKARLPLQAYLVIFALLVTTTSMDYWNEASPQLRLANVSALFVSVMLGLLLLSVLATYSSTRLSPGWISRPMNAIRRFSRPWRERIGQVLKITHATMVTLRKILYGLPSLLLTVVAFLLIAVALALPVPDSPALSVGWQLATLRIGVIVLFLGVLVAIPAVKVDTLPHRQSLENLQRAVASEETSPDRALRVYGSLLSGGKYRVKKDQ